MAVPPRSTLRLERLESRELPAATTPVVPVPISSSALVSSTRASSVSGPVRHYPHIRVAMLAYLGTPFGTLEQRLLRESVDLVVPNIAYLPRLNALAPNTPKMLYTNVSNIYEDLLTDWLQFADARRADRESAFYHVHVATAFTGNSGSSRPVNWFWGVYRGGLTNDWDNFTQVTANSPKTFELGVRGESVVFGYPERFRELNFQVVSAPGRGWSGVYEYVSAVDSGGRPIQWKTLSTISDTSGKLARSGRMTFDPPTDWKPAVVNGSDRLFYMRIRTIAGDDPPVIRSPMGRDYVDARGRTAGTIPAFDLRADRNGDGYLSDTEYNARQRGFDARFEYESRLFYPYYGQMRFATNPADPTFRVWAVDHAKRFLAEHPTAGGLFVDNSYGRLAVNPRGLQESLVRYDENYGTLLGQIDTSIGSKWVLANTAGSGRNALPLVRSGVSYLEEFALRPLVHHWQQFEDIAAMTAERMQLLGPSAYAILDTYPEGGSPTDPRTQLAALAYYYLLADPHKSFVMFNGGAEPSSEWARHWTDAVKFDIGKPRASWVPFSSGWDPSNRALQFKVFSRTYDKALVLYKPLSYTRSRTGTTGSATTTVHALNGRYRELRADGTLGPIVTQVRLRNGEGSILIRA